MAKKGEEQRSRRQSTRATAVGGAVKKPVTSESPTRAARKSQPLDLSLKKAGLREEGSREALEEIRESP